MTMIKMAAINPFCPVCVRTCTYVPLTLLFMYSLGEGCSCTATAKKEMTR